MMRAWFERDIQCRAPAFVSGHAQRFRLGMRTAESSMPALADNASAIHQDGADHWVWAHTAEASPGQPKGKLHIGAIVFSELGQIRMSSSEIPAGRKGGEKRIQLPDRYTLLFGCSATVHAVLGKPRLFLPRSKAIGPNTCFTVTCR